MGEEIKFEVGRDYLINNKETKKLTCIFKSQSDIYYGFQSYDDAAQCLIAGGGWVCLSGDSNVRCKWYQAYNLRAADDIQSHEEQIKQEIWNSLK
jgi:hypothetical protein